MLGFRRRRVSISRTILPIFLLTYLLLMMFLLVKMHISNGFYPGGNPYSDRQVSERFAPFYYQNVSDGAVPADGQLNQPPGIDVSSKKPGRIGVPIPKTGNFYALKDNSLFIYSAYLDDRKEDTYVRLIALAASNESNSKLFCRFQDDIYDIFRDAERYVLCENHNRDFGGYIFSCQVPDFLREEVYSMVDVSCQDCKRNLIVPVAKVRPPPHRIAYLDRFVEEPTIRYFFDRRHGIFNAFSGNRKKAKETFSADSTLRIPRLSVAICVPPLFGDISAYRLIEFIELSLLLGAEHIFFYEYKISSDIRRVLSHYAGKGLVSVTQWALPDGMTFRNLWYNGQLLAHNDCLYRAMPLYDLVAFNDIDEFIVPQANGTADAASTWSRAFAHLLSNTTCGFSFKSAFFDKPPPDPASPELQTLTISSRTREFSRFRSKVIACPWRVFEVGIHHISKQNRESWAVKQLPPHTAFLHHYRSCVDEGDRGVKSCSNRQPDTTILRGYGTPLKRQYKAALAAIFPEWKIYSNRIVHYKKKPESFTQKNETDLPA